MAQLIVMPQFFSDFVRRASEAEAQRTLVLAMLTLCSDDRGVGSGLK